MTRRDLSLQLAKIDLRIPKLPITFAFKSQVKFICDMAIAVTRG
ncbi:hypothetical protein [Microcoleus sp. herbarium19]